ncbi:type 1 fimbrial protein [Serratia nevei]|uniref:fimbrial protein n=1 Tax=Serratia nevei TaxID=2703794 RepID=UPI00209D3080|nr:fimbrial protein [Serratia nevei]MCP1107083.1 type 1 fimbrial protein [Serratia nevei]
MKHVLVIISISCLLLAALSPVARAAVFSQGEGRVNMQGAIIDTACAIATESREQIIDIDITSMGEITRQGKGRDRSFAIKLINCILERPSKELPDWKQFQVTFDGEADGDLFGVHGEAGGVAIMIYDEQGNVALPGEPLPASAIIPGDMTLKYSMTLVSNNQPFKAGSFSSAVRFKLDYY